MSEGSVVVGISGISGAGKTFLLDQLRKSYEDSVTTVSFDDYYRPPAEQFTDARGYLNFDLPGALDATLFHEHLLKLIQGHPVMHKKYRFENFEAPEEVFILSPARIIVAEGLFVFQFPQIDDLLDLRVFVETDLTLSLNRRLERDEKERGIQPEKSLYQWQNHVLPAYRNFIEPHRSRCDLVLNGAGDPEANLQLVQNAITGYFSGSSAELL